MGKKDKVTVSAMDEDVPAVKVSKKDKKVKKIVDEDLTDNSASSEVMDIR